MIKCRSSTVLDLKSSEPGRTSNSGFRERSAFSFAGVCEVWSTSSINDGNDPDGWVRSRAVTASRVMVRLDNNQSSANPRTRFDLGGHSATPLSLLDAVLI